MSLNKFIGSGRLTADPELKNVGESSKTCKFSVAIQRNYKTSNGDYECDFINCQCWKNQAEYLCKYARKGTFIELSGELRNSSYKNQDGAMQYVTFVNVSELSIIKTNNNNQETKETNEPQKNESEEYQGVSDDDMPF